MNEEPYLPLLAEYSATRDRSLRDRLAEAYLPLARNIARKFAGRGVETEDLEQVAALALLKALNRYDSSRGLRFAVFAVPTITGELRNHLRDFGNRIRLPHEYPARMSLLSRAQQTFEQTHFRAPTVPELAEAAHMPSEEVLLWLGYRMQAEAVSLDAPLAENENTDLAELLGGHDPGFSAFEDREWMQALLREVSDEEKQLLLLRCEERLGQRETAARMGVSQMQVSRMERRVLARLRAMEAHD